MSVAFAVIGAGYGDEGKGLATDYLTRILKEGPNFLVARCNGGTQAGHTVVDGERRHVFGHLSAGSFAGADTYLSQNFIVNPKLFDKEYRALASLNCQPKVYAHRDCRITTIYDMAINSLAELSRGSGRHGSCGMGINETVTRQVAGYWLTIEQLLTLNVTQVSEIMRQIVEEWIPARLADLGLSDNSKFESMGEDVLERVELYRSMFRIDRVELVNEMRADLKNISFANPKSLDNRDVMVIEGAQGLGLDEFHGEFPYVTRSVTGLASHIVAAHECGFPTVQPIYVTRTYTTRHGAGPLEGEGAQFTNADAEKLITDPTNIPNQWQGTLRYAPLNLDKLYADIVLDVARGLVVSMVHSISIAKPIIFLTCMDQLGENVGIIHEGSYHEIPTEELQEKIGCALDAFVAFISYGNSAEDVKAFS